MKKTIYVYTIISFFLIGCSTTDPSKRYASEEHLLNKIETNDDEGYFIEYKSSIDAPQNKDKSIKYLEKGIALTRTVCFDYLNSLSANENDSQFLKNELGALVILSTGIMGLNGVSQDSFTRLALGGAAVNTTIDLYRNHYLLGPDSDVIVDLIKNAMNTAETEIGNRTPNNFVQAYTLLQSYSSLCSDSSIRRLVRDTIKSATLEASSPIVNIVAEEVLTQIKYLFRRVRSLSSDYEKAIADAKEKIAQAENKIDSNNDLSNFIGTFSSISSSQALTSITSLAGNDEKLEYATERISNEILLKVPSQVMAISPNSGVQIKVK
jgi:hypothetical protein